VSLPKEPRQKMINLMYLVLTAMLALNVSAEILNAFRTVNHSLATANEIIEAKNQGLFQSFQRKMADPKTAEKAKIWNDKATSAKSLADNLYGYIEGLKSQLMKESGQKEPGGEYREDNLDAPIRMLVDGGKGKELHQKLEDFKNGLLNIDPEIRKEFEKTLPIDLTTPKVENHSNSGDWSSAYFRMTPTIASITMLSKFQNDVKNSEAQVVDFCHRKVGEVEVVYNEFQAFAGTNSQYLMPGQELVITAGVGAFSKAAKPNISVDGSGVGLNADGVAEYKTTVGGPGTYTKTVNISFVKPDGSTSTIAKKVEYTVGSPTGASVSADAVKVLYIGLPNPLTISGGSGGAEKTQASITNGNLVSKGGGKYIAEVSTPGKATINVTVDGKTTPFEFRVKRVPDPIAMVGTNEGGRVAANLIKAQQGVRADLRDFVFEGVKFDILGFTVYATGAGFGEQPGISPNGGAYFNGDSKRILDKCRPGTTLVIDEIKAVGPGGGTRKLQPLVFNLY
jgi:gliding motility-associated protein GldM